MKNLGFLGFSRYAVDVFGNVYSLYSDRFLKLFENPDGYLVVGLHSDSTKKVKKFSVHRLVGLCFCDNPDNKPQINHKDGDKRNNFFKNLEWCTAQENTIHAYKNGLYINKKGLSIEEIHKVCKMLEQGMKSREITDILGLTSTKYVQMIKNKERWTCISEEYDIHHTPNRIRIDVATVKKICEALTKGWTITKISKEYGVGTSTVHRIKHRRTYSDVSSPYNF